MKDFGFFCFWCDNFEDFKQEFIEFYNSTVNDKDNGLYTLIFTYNVDYSVFSECVYFYILNNIICFLYNSQEFEIKLDKNFNVIDFVINDDKASLFVLFLDSSNFLHYIGDYCDCKGNLFKIFTPNNDVLISNFLKSFKNYFPDEFIYTISNEEIFNASLEFINNKKDVFLEQIKNAKNTGDIPENIENNPYQKFLYM